MTKPTLSYGVVFLDDMPAANLTNWAWLGPGIDGTLGAVTCPDDDQFAIPMTASAGDADCNYRNVTPFGISTTAYPWVRFRYHTDGGSIKLTVKAVYNDTTFDTLLASGNSKFWKAITVEMTPGKTLSYLEFHLQSATGTVYLEFVLIYAGDFSFPNTELGQEFTPGLRKATMDGIGARGQMTEYLGTDLAEFTCSCDLDLGGWKRSGDVIDGEVFLEDLELSMQVDWWWLTTSDGFKFKCCIDKPVFQREVHESKTSRILHLTFHEFRRAPANNETTEERWGINS